MLNFPIPFIDASIIKRVLWMTSFLLIHFAFFFCSIALSSMALCFLDFQFLLYTLRVEEKVKEMMILTLYLFFFKENKLTK